MVETIVFSPDDLKEEFEEIFDGIEAHIIPTGSIEMRFTKQLKPELYMDADDIES